MAKEFCLWMAIILSTHGAIERAGGGCQSGESARQRLMMDILSNYKGTKQATVILVFDGYLVKGISVPSMNIIIFS